MLCGIQLSEATQLHCTAYSYFDSLTASGTVPRVGICASDDLPFGTVVILPDGTQLVVEDRFGGGYRGRLDIFMATYDEAINFGVRDLDCEIIYP